MPLLFDIYIVVRHLIDGFDVTQGLGLDDESSTGMYQAGILRRRLEGQ